MRRAPVVTDILELGYRVAHDLFEENQLNKDDRSEAIWRRVYPFYQGTDGDWHAR